MAGRGDGLFGGSLGGDVECGAHDQVITRRPDKAADLISNPVHEIARIAAIAGVVHGDRCGFRRDRLRRVQTACGHHGVKHDGGAVARGLEIAGGCVTAGCLWQPGKHGGLGECQAARGLAEIAPGGRLHTETAGPQIDAVEVDSEQRVLGVSAFEPQCQKRFLNLAPQGAFGCEEHVLGDLLGEGRAALHDSAGGEVDDGGARQPPDIDAEMAVEAAVFDGHHGVDEGFRQFLHRNIGAVNFAEIGEDGTVIGGDSYARSARLGDHAVYVGQADSQYADGSDEQDEPPYAGDDREINQAAQQTPRGKAGPLARGAAGRCTRARPALRLRWSG